MQNNYILLTNSVLSEYDKSQTMTVKNHDNTFLSYQKVGAGYKMKL